MVLYVNTEANPSNALVRADRKPSPLRNLVFGDTVGLELGFVDASGVAVAFSPATTVNVGIGSASSLLAFSDNFAASGNFWTGSLNLSTSGLSGALVNREAIKSLFEVETVLSGVPKTWVQQEINVLNQVLSSPLSDLDLPYYYTKDQVDALVPSGSALTGAGTVTITRIGSDVIVSGRLNTAIYQSTIPTGTVSGGGFCDLMTQNVAANTLARNGDRLRITALFAAASGETRIRGHLGTTLFYDVSSFNMNAHSWGASNVVGEMLLTRTGANGQNVYSRTTHDDYSPQPLHNIPAFTGVSLSMASAHTLRFSASGRLAGDVLQRDLMVELIPAP